LALHVTAPWFTHVNHRTLNKSISSFRPDILMAIRGISFLVVTAAPPSTCAGATLPKSQKSNRTDHRLTHEEPSNHRAKVQRIEFPSLLNGAKTECKEIRQWPVGSLVTIPCAAAAKLTLAASLAPVSSIKTECKEIRQWTVGSLVTIPCAAAVKLTFGRQSRTSIWYIVQRWHANPTRVAPRPSGGNREL
jgi:hypothetical protein